MFDRSPSAYVWLLLAFLSASSGCDVDAPPPVDANVETCTDDVVNGGDCRYAGAGSTCSVPCAMEAGCVFRLSIRWSEPYCCGFPDESFTNCVCEAGQTVCGDPLMPPGRRVPSTACDSCGADASSP